MIATRRRRNWTTNQPMPAAAAVLLRVIVSWVGDSTMVTEPTPMVVDVARFDRPMFCPPTGCTDANGTLMVGSTGVARPTVACGAAEARAALPRCTVEPSRSSTACHTISWMLSVKNDKPDRFAAAKKTPAPAFCPNLPPSSPSGAFLDDGGVPPLASLGGHAARVG